MKPLKVVSFNVLADAHIHMGDYRHVRRQELLEPGARLVHLLQLIDELGPDILGLQEVDVQVAAALAATRKWRLRYTRGATASEGCLLLVRRELPRAHFSELHYSDPTGRVAQSATIGGVTFYNTHIEYGKGPAHIGVQQTRQLLAWVDPGRAVVMGDFNDRPGGPVRALLTEAGLVTVTGYQPTAKIGKELAALDIIASRGVYTEPVVEGFDVGYIPHEGCPSDHIPVSAIVTL